MIRRAMFDKRGRLGPHQIENGALIMLQVSENTTQQHQYENIADALDELSSTRYKDLIPESEDDAEMISKFEHSFEMATYKAVNGSFSKMFSFATTVAISKLIAYEIRNISAIAFAVEQKIPIETTMAKLIISED